MKKGFLLLGTLILTVVLAACGQSGSDDSSNGNSGDNGKKDKKPTKLVVGATAVPHAEVLEQAKPMLKKKGIDLKIEQFQDYVTPNKALSKGELDANYYQHIPFLKKQKKEFGYNFAVAGKIHIEPMGVYSQQYDNLEDIPKDGKIIMSNSVADTGRMLMLLQKGGLIKLDPDVNPVKARIDDIVKNPKNLSFSKVDPGMLARIYQNGEGDAVIINTNYALDADLNPTKDAVIIEDAESPYVNVVAVKKENKDNQAIQTLVDVLHSKKIQNFIKEKYDGAVVPVKG